MCRRCRIEWLLVVVLVFQVAVFVVSIFIPVWNSAFHAVSTDDRESNESGKFDSFLVEYNNYCSSQLIPATKASNVATSASDAAVSSSLCPCVPDTLGKCLHLV